MKKLCFLLSIIMLFTCLQIPNTVQAAEDVSEMVEALKSIGIFDASKMEHTEYVERGEFVQALSKFVYEDDVDPKIAGVNLGMYSEEENFEEELYITLAEAVKNAVILLGYSDDAEALGGVDGYMDVAREHKLLKGIEIPSTWIMYPEDAVRLLYNVMEAEVRTIEFVTNSSYEVIHDKTLLSTYKGIERIKGVVNQTPRTSMDKFDGCGEGYIKIDSTLYKVADIDVDDYIGMNVEAWVDMDEEEETVVHIKGNKNEFLTIDNMNILGVAEDFSYIEYYDKAERRKKAKLSLTPSIFYNGKFKSDYEADDFMPSVGSLTLLDNNNDGRADVVFIISAYNIVVDSFAKDPAIIHNKLSIVDKEKFIELDSGTANISYEIISDGIKVPINFLADGDILSVAKNEENGEQFVSLHLSREKIKGHFGGFYDNYIRIDSTEYPVTKRFKQWIDEMIGTIDASKENTFCLDAFGNVAYMEFETLSNSNYVLMLKRYNDEDNDAYLVKYMDVYGVWHKSPLAEKVKLNETKGTDEYVYAEMEGLKPQIAVMFFNSNGEIKEIKTAVQYGPKNKLNDFTKKDFANVTCESPETKGFSNKVYYTDSTRVFVFPSSESFSEEDYSVKGVSNFFREWHSYDFSAYDLDEFFTAPILSVVESDYIYSKQINSRAFVVTEKMTVLNEDDEPVLILKGAQGNNMDAKITEETTGVLSGYVKGDIIRVASHGEKVYYAEKLGNIFETDGVPPGDLKDGSRVGEIIDTSLSDYKIKMQCGTEPYVIVVNPNATIKFFDKSGCRKGTFSELRKGQRVIIGIEFYRATDIVVNEY